MFQLQFIVNGFYPVTIGTFDSTKEAVTAMKEHIRFHSAISRPKYSKSWKDNRIRIDYGAVDCYYLIIVDVK